MSITYFQTIDLIRNDILILAQTEYDKFDYVPTKTSAKELKGLKDDVMAVNSLNYQIQQMAIKKESKQRLKPNSNITDEDVIENTEMQGSILTDDAFNIIKDDTEYVPWRKLDEKERQTVLEKYFDDLDSKIGDNIKDKLWEMFKNGGLMTKKEIEYDKVNRKIICIPLLTYIDGQYVFREKKKIKTNNINKIIKIK